MVHHQFLPINEIIKDGCNHGLHTPNGGNNTYVDVSHVRVVHGKENKTHDSKKETALYDEPQHIHPSNFASYNEILIMPASFLAALPNNVDSTTKDSSAADIKNCGHSVNFRCKYTYDAVRQEKIQSRSDCVGQPFFQASFLSVWLFYLTSYWGDWKNMFLFFFESNRLLLD